VWLLRSDKSWQVCWRVSDVVRAVARLSEQTRQMSQAPKVRASRGGGVWRHAPPENFKIYSLWNVIFSVFSWDFSSKFNIVQAVKRQDFSVLSTFFISTIRACIPRHQVDGYPEFCIALIHPHPHLPASSPAMAGFQFLTHANTVLLQDYQIQLQLRTVGLYCGLRENFISWSHQWTARMF